MFRIRFGTVRRTNLPSSATASRIYLTLHVKISKLFLLASLLIATAAAQAGKPVLGTVIESDHIYPWEMQRINASEWAERGDATKAFNFLQDQLGRPHIDEVWYDFDSDFFHWRGPATGNRMAMTREQFERDSFPLLRRDNGKTYLAITSIRRFHTRGKS